MNTDIKEHLILHGIKPSPQRMAVMEYILSHHTHPTVEEVFAALHPNIPTLSKTTVYNTLKLLSDKGAVTAVTIDDRNIRYDGEAAFHAHFRCKNCGAIHDIRVKELSIHLHQESKSHKLTDVQIYYHGYCQDCKKKIKI